MKKKILFIAGIIVMVVLIYFALVFWVFSPSAISDNQVLLEELESTKIKNPQQTYTINLETVENQNIMFVGFYITDKDDNIVFVSDEQWRVFDFKNVAFDENDNITVTTGDTGKEIFYFETNEDGAVKWVHE